MRLSRYVLPTLKEVPADTIMISHILMLRAGMIRRLGPGIYNYLPLAMRTLKKITSIIREEMDGAGGLELLMPMVQPADIWQESDRRRHFGPELLCFKDRKNTDYCLGPGHEEVITHIARDVLSSYRDLPVVFYQIQHKFRDEIRPRFGLVRGREFMTHDAYSFDTDMEGAHTSYELMKKTCEEIFTRCGLGYRVAEAGTDTTGGSISHEFQVPSQNGEDTLLSCPTCDYAATIEKAECKQPHNNSPGKPGPDSLLPERIHTPGQRTIEEVAVFLSTSRNRLIKTLIYMADTTPIAILIRGDHDLAEQKAKEFLQCENLAPADEETILRITGGPVGFSGPVGLKTHIPIYGDNDVAFIESGIVGGNEKDIHIKNMWPARDFPAHIIYADLKKAAAGMECPRCERGSYHIEKTIEVGHLICPGTHYSKKMNASVLDEHGEAVPLVMGSYSIGISRTMAAVIEQSHDENGIIWPMSIAPFHVIICPVGTDPGVIAVAETLYEDLKKNGTEVLMDDRQERPGVMFKDADLTGIPLRVTIGKRSLQEGNLEVKLRREEKAHLIPVNEVPGYIKDCIQRECHL